MQATPEKIRSLTRPIFQKYNSIDLAYLFGSVANQTSGKLSDIDIGIFVIEKLSTKDILNLQLDLIGELTSALNVNSIDLAVMNLASNTLNFEIIKCNYPLFVKNEDIRIDVEQRIHSTYLDRRYHESLYNQIFLQQLGARKHYDWGSHMSGEEKITRKLQTLDKFVAYLNSRKNVSKQELGENYELKSAIERNFQLAIESVLDIGEIIIAIEEFDRPETYRDVILILGKYKIIPGKFAQDLSQAAGFRNILVHLYEEVKIDFLYDFLHERLRDFMAFEQYITQYVEKKNSEKKS